MSPAGERRFFEERQGLVWELDESFGEEPGQGHLDVILVARPKASGVVKNHMQIFRLDIII